MVRELPVRREMGRKSGGDGTLRPPSKAFHRTKMCRFYLLGMCNRGSSCLFAHTPEDLKTRPDFSCTRLCERLLSTGTCDVEGCRFAHNRQELRQRKQAAELAMPADIPQELWIEPEDAPEEPDEADVAGGPCGRGVVDGMDSLALSVASGISEGSESPSSTALQSYICPLDDQLCTDVGGDILAGECTTQFPECPWSRQSTMTGPVWSRQTSLYRQESESSTRVEWARLTSPSSEGWRGSGSSPMVNSSASLQWFSPAPPEAKGARNVLAGSKEEVLMPELQEGVEESTCPAAQDRYKDASPIRGVMCGLEFKVAKTFLHFDPMSDPHHNVEDDCLEQARSSSLPARFRR